MDGLYRAHAAVVFGFLLGLTLNLLLDLTYGVLDPRMRAPAASGDR